MRPADRVTFVAIARVIDRLAASDRDRLANAVVNRLAARVGFSFPHDLANCPVARLA